jgi:hypothetical protein
VCREYGKAGKESRHKAGYLARSEKRELGVPLFIAIEILSNQSKASIVIVV